MTVATTPSRGRSAPFKHGFNGLAAAIPEQSFQGAEYLASYRLGTEHEAGNRNSN